MICCLHSDVPTQVCFTQMLGVCCLLVHIDVCTAKRNRQWLDTYRAVNTQKKIWSKCQLLTHIFLPFRSTWVQHRFLSGVRVARSLVFCVVFCGSSYVVFFFWSLCCLPFFELLFFFTEIYWLNFEKIHSSNYKTVHIF